MTEPKATVVQETGRLGLIFIPFMRETQSGKYATTVQALLRIFTCTLIVYTVRTRPYQTKTRDRTYDDAMDELQMAAYLVKPPRGSERN